MAQQTATWEEDDATSHDDTPVRGALLVWGGGAPELRSAALGRAPEVIGREGAFGHPLDDPRASRRHVELSLDGAAFVVCDLDSRNGTFVDGARVRGAARARPPAIVRFGSSIVLLLPDVRPFERFALDRRPHLVAGPAFSRALNEVARASRGGAALLLTGESGSGKEVAAQTFHAEGPHASGPLVAVNCATIPHGLAERLMFGARRGAYSGATSDAEGYVQAAHGGTLFLDEVAELDPLVQAKLLRVLETGEVLELGASRPRHVSVRVCSATHKDLKGEVEAGRFRADLYYRMGTFEVRLPALRERREEIPWLLARELARIDGALKADVKVVEACLERAWPGNVRELFAAVRYAAHQALGASTDVVTTKHLHASAGMSLAREGAAKAEPAVKRSAPTREAVEAALRESGGNVAATARALGLHRTQLYRVMRDLGLAQGRVGGAG